MGKSKLSKPIDYEHLPFDMSKIGEFSDYYVYVYSKEYIIPHFHFINKNSPSLLKEGCIRLDKAEYYNHDHEFEHKLNSDEINLIRTSYSSTLKSGLLKIDNNGFFNKNCEIKLNNLEIAKLIEFLNDKSIFDHKITNWELLLICWNADNYDYKIDFNTPMPDYIKLASFI